MKPNLFLCGKPKGGTTAIHKFLNRHSDVSMSSTKELHILNQPSWDKQAYYQRFSALENTYVGESTPTYLHDKQAVQRMHEVNTDAKILVNLREPSQFAQSWEEHVRRRRGYEQVNADVLFSSSDSVSDWRERTNYAEDIQRLFDYFPPHQVHILLYEDFAADNQSAMSSIFRFLDLSPEDVVGGEYNQSVRPVFSWLDAFVVSFNHGVWLDKLPISLRKKLVNFAKTILFEDKEYSVSPEHKELFKDDVIRLQHVLNEAGYDINAVSRWGYEGLVSNDVFDKIS